MPSGPAFQRCEDCRSAVHPRRVLCPVCGSRRLADECSAGHGVVYSTTTVHAREGRYNVALVDLDEGFRVMSEVVGIAPDDVRIGMGVRARDDGGRIVFDAA
ncbi:MAG TPA: OB-fold domain-containing protein [Solirubrobacteraceae bacterium]